MKQWKKIVISSVILVVLIVALIVTSLFKGKGAPETNLTPTPAIDPVVDIAEKDIAKITVENSNGTLIFTPGASKTESGDAVINWSLTSPKSSFYSETTISRKIAYYILVEAQGIITASQTNLAEYGLDKPSATILITLKTGEKKKILFGKETASSESFYAMLEGSGRICVASSINARAAMLSSLEFLDTAVVLNNITVAEAKQVQFARKSDNANFLAISNNNASADGQTAATWQITSPIKGDADSGYSTLLGQLVAITASAYIETAPKDLSKYGLDKPSYEFTITGDKKKIHCILGGSAGDGLLYAYSDYVDAVFTMSTSALTSIDIPFLDVVTSFVSLPAIWKVSAIDIKIDNQTIRCDIDDDQDNDTKPTYKLNGQDATVMDSSDNYYFKAFYQAVLSVFIKDIDLKATPVYQPVITIDYTMNDATPNTHIGFVKRDDSTYYVFKEGIYTGYFVDRDNFYSEEKGNEGILPAYNILLDAVKNQVNGIYK